jgi:hypothetical protein
VIVAWTTYLWASWELLLVIAAVLLEAIVLTAIHLVKESRKRRESTVRGFEVKQNTGPTPVLREKENDHG